MGSRKATFETKRLHLLEFLKLNIRIFQSYKPQFSNVFVHVLISHWENPCERIWAKGVPSAQAMNSEEFKALLKERPLTLRSGQRVQPQLGDREIRWKQTQGLAG